MNEFLHRITVAISRLFLRFLPDRIPVTYAGSGSSRELCESIGHMATGRLLIVTDATLVEIGLVGRITAVLDECGIDWSIYSGVESDPTFAQVEAGWSQLRRDGCEGVLAVGGGSSIDAAKVIAALATNPGPTEKLEGMMKVKRAPAPFFAIPTTAGTGSEVTFAAVVSDSTSHQKRFFADPKLLPIACALDPVLMTGLPAPITAATGMDALTHAVESYVSRLSTPVTESYAELAVRLIFRHLPVACADGENLEARKAMALASYYAGLAFTRTNVGYVHAIAHTFGAWYRTPHGLANAIALPHVLDFSKAAAEDRLARLGTLVGCRASSDGERAALFIQAVRDLMTKIDVPSTLDALAEDDIPAIAKQAIAEARFNYPVPQLMDETECEDLLRRMRA